MLHICVHLLCLGVGEAFDECISHVFSQMFKVLVAFHLNCDRVDLLSERKGVSIEALVREGLIGSGVMEFVPEVVDLTVDIINHGL